MNGSRLKKSFQYAGRGFYKLIFSEQNIKIHLGITAIILVFGIFLQINPTEWAIIILVIGLVFCTEIINTAVEKMLDYLYPKDRRTAEQDHMVGVIKDSLAGGVLVAAVISVLVGLLIFLPYILKYF